MKRAIAVLLTTALAAVALVAAPVDAGPKRTRKVSGVYNGGVGRANWYATNFGGIRVPTKRTEAYVRVKIVDAGGLPIGFRVGQDTDGDGAAEEVGSGCGRTKAPITLLGGIDVIVFVGELQTCDRPIPATKGAIELTLSNVP